MKKIEKEWDRELFPLLHFIKRGMETPLYQIRGENTIFRVYPRRKTMKNGGLCDYFVDENGKIEGEVYGYDKNGKLAFSAMYRDNLPDGKVMIYDDKIRVITHYKKGKIIDSVYIDYKDGTMEEITLKNQREEAVKGMDEVRHNNEVKRKKKVSFLEESNPLE